MKRLELEAGQVYERAENVAITLLFVGETNVFFSMRKNDTYRENVKRISEIEDSWTLKPATNIVELKRGIDGFFYTLDHKSFLKSDGVLGMNADLLELFPINSKTEYFDLESKQFVEGLK